MRPGYEDAIDRHAGAAPVRRQFMILCAVIGMPGVAIVMSLFIIQSFQATHCPPNTLLWGGTKDGRLELLLPWMVSGIGWFVCQRAAGSLERQGRLLAGCYEPAVLRHWANWLLPVGVAVSVLFTIDVGLSEFCMFENRILVRLGLFAETKNYQWSSVREVVARCSGDYHNGDEWYSYRLVMNDGQVIDLGYGPNSGPENPPLFKVIVHVVGKGLRDVPYRYDASGVRAQCDEPFKELMLKRPTDLP